MRPGDNLQPPAELQTRVRRLATLRAAQRALYGVIEPDEFQEALKLGRKLLRRLQALSEGHARAEILDREAALQGVDNHLTLLAGRVREVLVTAPTPLLCAGLARFAREESGAVRSLAAVALEAAPDSERIRDLVEFLVALLSCDGAPGAREVTRSPLTALPELADTSAAEVWEAHPDIDEAEQIFGRAGARLDRDDLGATRERIHRFRRRLGVRRLNPDVMAAAVAYDVAMANRLAALSKERDPFDALAEVVFSASEGEVSAARELDQRRGPTALPVKQEAMRSRLFWHAVATVGASICLLALAVQLWQRPSVQVIPDDSAATISPHLVAGYVSGDDGVPHFIGTVGSSWDELALRERRRVVVRIAARLEADGVRNLTLVDGHRAIQARHDGDTLLWVTEPR